MERVRWADARYRDEAGREHTLRYDLLLEAGVEGVRYGVSVQDRAGDGAQVRDLTSRRERAEEVLALLARNTVTPVTLRDVIDDLL